MPTELAPQYKNDSADDVDEVQKCRVCTISSECFSYYNIFEKTIFKNVLILDALTLITNLHVRHHEFLNLFYTFIQMFI